MLAATDNELVAELEALRTAIANAFTTPAVRMMNMRQQQVIERELERRAASKRNLSPAPPVQPFDLDGFEKQNGWRRD